MTNKCAGKLPLRRCCLINYALGGASHSAARENFPEKTSYYVQKLVTRAGWIHTPAFNYKVKLLPVQLRRGAFYYSAVMNFSDTGSFSSGFFSWTWEAREREYHNSSSKLGHWMEIYRAWRWKSWSCIHYAVTRLFMHEAQIGGDPFPAALVTTTQKIMHNPLVTTDFLFHWSLVKRQRNIEMDESRPSVFRAGWAALEIDVARVERFYFKIKLWSLLCQLTLYILLQNHSPGKLFRLVFAWGEQVVWKTSKDWIYDNKAGRSVKVFGTLSLSPSK